MLINKTIEYTDGHNVLQGYYAYDDSITSKRPAVLVAHDWSGLNDFARQRANELAKLGYVGFALDMYGKDKLGNTNEKKLALMTPLMQDRSLLQKRILAGLDTAKSLEQTDTQRTAAIGFCFGGLCVLDLARSGAEVNGVVSFHGLFLPPTEKTHTNHIHAKVLALHGYDDPMVKPDQVLAFCHEMTTAKANWQLDMYGNTMHGFTNPEANDPNFGAVYSKLATERSWIAMKSFLAEVF